MQRSSNQQPVGDRLLETPWEKEKSISNTFEEAKMENGNPFMPTKPALGKQWQVPRWSLKTKIGRRSNGTFLWDGNTTVRISMTSAGSTNAMIYQRSTTTGYREIIFQVRLNNKKKCRKEALNKIYRSSGNSRLPLSYGREIKGIHFSLTMLSFGEWMERKRFGNYKF